jgi:trimeric autotransporter adhesin
VAGRHRRRRAHFHRSHISGAIPTLGIIFVCASLAANASRVDGGFTAQVVGSGGLRSATLLLSTSNGGVNCLSSANAAGAIGAPTSTCPTVTVAQGSATTITAASQGSLSPTAASVATGSACGVESATDLVTTASDSAGTDTGTVVGGVAAGQPGPSSFTDAAYSYSFDGSTGNITTALNLSGPQTFSESVWFKTSRAGESIMGFSSLQAATQPGSGWDRFIWLDSSGHLVFGIFPTTYFELNSSATTTKNYADGTWHQVVVTITPVSTTKATVLMYADGQLVAGSASNETESVASSPGQVYTGYWHLGWDTENTWSGAPSNYFFQGNLADAAIFPSALSSAQVSSLYGQTSQAGYASAAQALSPSYFWTLQDRSSATSGLIAGGVTEAQTGPVFTDTVRSMSFNGSSGAVDVSASETTPQSYTLSLWEKTSTPGRAIAGMSSSIGQTTPSSFDRMLWIDASGHLVFGTQSAASGNFEVTSSTTNAANGFWHSIDVVVSAVSATVGTVEIYEDGSLVAGAASNETISGSQTGASYTGFWHLGWAYTSGWSNPPSSNYFSGSLTDVGVKAAALTPTQIVTLATMTSQALYSSTLVADGVGHFWPLQDVTTSSFTGSISGLSANTTLDYRDATGSAATGTAVGTVVPYSSGPLGDGATAFDGTSGYLKVSSSEAAAQTLSIALWMKTSTANHSIMEFTDAQTTGQSHSDRELALTSTGALTFGLWNGAATWTTSSGTNYADGNWHFIVVTATPTSTTQGTVLIYADGALVAGSANDETLLAAGQISTQYSGYWHIGFGPGVGLGAANPYFAGDLAQVAVLPSVLSSSAVSSLYHASTQAGYDAQVSTIASHYWPLDEAYATGSAACSYVGIALGTSAGCIYPASAAPCPAQDSAPFPGALNATVPTTATTLTIGTTSLAASTLVSTLHLVGTITVGVSGGGFTASTTTPILVGP